MKVVSFVTVIFATFISCDKKEYKTANLEVEIPKTVTKDTLHTQETDFQKWAKHFSESPLPYRDSTNFDNVEKLTDLSDKEISQLKLKELFPGISSFKINHHFNFSENFESLSITYFKGEMELSTELINYNPTGEVIDHIEISYDEIAESAFRKESLIDKNGIIVYSINSFEEPVKTEKNEFFINPDGRFKNKK